MSYPRPPITEAVIEFRFAQPVEQSLVEKAAKRLRGAYVFEDFEKLVDFQLEPENERARVVKNRWLGVKLSSADRADVALVRVNILGFSRLAPYLGWNDFAPRARKGLEVWRKVAGPTEIDRIGVRYVNRIDIPVSDDPLIRIEDYLRVFPRFPDEFRAPLSAYTMQLVRPLGEDECNLIVTSGTVPSPLVGFTSLLLDLDVYREGALPRRPDELWDLVEKMRHHKNRVFENCITDRARMIFGQ